MNLLTVVDRINKQQKRVLFDKVVKHFKGDIKGKNFAVWGLAFKPNTDDMREAPSVVIINELLKAGARVSAYDPAAIETSKFYLKDTINYARDEYDALKNADALLIFTEWNEFRNPDFEKVSGLLKNKLIFDGRNIYAVSVMKELGYTYYSIGRKTVTGD